MLAVCDIFLTFFLLENLKGNGHYQKSEKNMILKFQWTTNGYNLSYGYNPYQNE